MDLPTNWQELQLATKTHSVAVLRPGLADPFGRYTKEFGFIVTLSPLENQVKASHRGYGLTLDEAIQNLEETPKV